VTSPSLRPLCDEPQLHGASLGRVCGGEKRPLQRSFSDPGQPLESWPTRW
jgi:hypothetical protein